AAPRALPSLPTRRSSDLDGTAQHAAYRARSENSSTCDVGRSNRLIVPFPACLSGKTPSARSLKAGEDRGYRVLAGLARHGIFVRSEEHTSELQSRENLVC